MIILSIGIGAWCFYLGHISLIGAFYIATMILAGMSPRRETGTIAEKRFSSYRIRLGGISF